MVAAADGSVRVWRDYTYRGSQRLATAWQVRSPGKPRAVRSATLLLCHTVVRDGAFGARHSALRPAGQDPIREVRWVHADCVSGHLYQNWQEVEHCPQPYEWSEQLTVETLPANFHGFGGWSVTLPPATRGASCEGACAGCAAGRLFSSIRRGWRAQPQRLRVERAAQRRDPPGSRRRGTLHGAPLEPAAGDLHRAGVALPETLPLLSSSGCPSRDNPVRFWQLQKKERVLW